MFNSFSLQLGFVGLIAVFIVLNRSSLVDPRIPLAGLFVVVILWGIAGVYTLISKYSLYSKGSFILSLGELFHVLLSLLPWLLVSVFLLKLQQYPPIHDISTDTTLPPQFRHVKALRHPVHNSVEYDSHAGKLQRSAYPSIQPLFFDLPPSILLSAIEALASNESWILHHVDFQQGLIEASESTHVLGFVDDIIIRVQANGLGSRVDIRSASRVGVSDLGANADRIEQFSASLDFVAEKLVAKTKGI